MRMAFDTDTGHCETNNKAMSPDQFDQVVRAILEGKYSWACVLILKFAGYNPAHYIPYRTYKRLIKKIIVPAKLPNYLQLLRICHP